MEIHNRGMFHQCSVGGCQVINFQMFAYRCSIYEMDAFGGFWGPLIPKYCSIFYSPIRQRHCLNNLYVCLCLCINRMYPNFTVLVYFWALFTPWKIKNTAKKPKFLQNCIFRTVKQYQPQVLKKLQYSYKIYKSPNIQDTKWA